MRNAFRLFVSLSFFGIIFGSLPAEAKTCFIVGQCGGELEGVAKTQDCQDLGYSIKSCPSGQEPAGARCGEYYEYCKCKDIYKYTNDGTDADKYEYKDPCTDRFGTHYKTKVCLVTYRYVETQENKNKVSTTPYYSAGLCTNNSIPFEGDYGQLTYGYCNEVMGNEALNNIKRYEWCACDKAIYKYQKEGNNSYIASIFNLSGECKGSDNVTTYSTASCIKTAIGNSYYSETCGDDYKYSQSEDKVLKDRNGNNGHVCHKCVKKGCDDVSGYSYDNCIAKLSVNDGKQCRPHETIANCYILEEGGQCPVTLPSTTTCPEGYTQGTCPNGQWCAQKDGCYKVIEKYGCSAVCSKALHTASYMPYMRDVAVFLKNLISINKAHAQTVVVPIGGGGIGGGTITKTEYTTYWSEKSSTTCAGGEVADCYECKYSGYGVRNGALYDSKDSCNSGGTACDKLYEGYYYTVGNSTINFGLDDEEDVGGSCYTVRYTTVYD